MTTAIASPVTSYAEAAIRGEIVVGRLVRLACERHLRDLETGHERGLYFDEDAAQFAIDFFGHLTLSGSGGDKPFILEPWEAFIVGSLFGWKLADGTRRFRVGYVEIGKGNGKSPLAAGIGLLMLIADGEDRAEVYSAAVDRDQAQILFRDAVEMVNHSPALDSRLVRSGSKGKEWNLAYLATSSFFRPISSEHTGGRGKSGFRVHCGLLDEVHEHPTSAMVDFMRANAKGRQPLIFEITNSGHNKATVCGQHHDMSVSVLRGAVENDAWFAFVCGLDPCSACLEGGMQEPKDGCEDCDDWRDESTWVKANPNLGVSISHRYLRELVAEAVAMPSKQNIVKRLNFCLWTRQATLWLPDELWMGGAGEVDIEGLAKKDCIAGLVVSSTFDIAALVLYFPSGDVLPFYWCPEERIIVRSRDESVPYDQWARDGLLTATKGNVIDFDAIRAKLNELWLQYNIKEVVTKRWNATQLQTQLMDDGFTVLQAGDGYKDMSAGAKELERRLIEKSLRHGGDPVLRWMASNIAVRTDPEGNIRPDKETSTEIAYGVEALIIAIGRGLTEFEDKVGVFFA